MKNIYTTQLSEKTTFAKKEGIIAKGLDEQVPYIHSLDKNQEKFIQRFAILHNGNKHNIILSNEAQALNEKVIETRQRQAKYILMEIAKLGNCEEEMQERIDYYGTLKGDDFRNLLNTYAYVKTKEGRKVIDEKAINDIFMKSTELENEYDLETYEEDKKTIEFNNELTQNPNVELYEDAAKDVIKSLDYNKKDIDKALENIKKDKDPEKRAIEEFKNLLEKRSSKIPNDDRTEEAVIDEAKKLYIVINNYAKDKVDFNIQGTLYEYITNEDNKFRDFAIGCSSPNATSSLAVLNSDESKFETVINNIKHLQEIHSKRSWFSRFVNWFSSKGENSTIEKLKNQLLKGEYTKEELDRARENGTKLNPDKMPHTKEEIENALRESKGKIDGLTVNEHIEDIKKYGTLKNYAYFVSQADDKLYNVLEETFADEIKEANKVQDSSFQENVKEQTQEKEGKENDFEPEYETQFALDNSILSSDDDKEKSFELYDE